MRRYLTPSSFDVDIWLRDKLRNQRVEDRLDTLRGNGCTLAVLLSRQNHRHSSIFLEALGQPMVVRDADPEFTAASLTAALPIIPDRSFANVESPSMAALVEHLPPVFLAFFWPMTIGVAPRWSVRLRPARSPRLPY